MSFEVLPVKSDTHNPCYAGFVNVFRSKFILTKLHILQQVKSKGYANEKSVNLGSSPKVLIGKINFVREYEDYYQLRIEQYYDEYNEIFEAMAYKKESQDFKFLTADIILGFLAYKQASKIYIKQIVWPVHAKVKTEIVSDSYLIGVSDIHVGSKLFCKDEFNNLIDYINAHPKIKYFVAAGDIVDGCGVYPGHELSLEIKNIDEQYRIAGEILSKVKPDVTIFIGTGNHDFVPISEPQHPIPQKYRHYFTKNCIFVTNPCYINIEGLIYLLYHGRCLDSIIRTLPIFSYEKIIEPMQFLLKTRHLSPIYDDRCVNLLTEIDNMFIDPIPDILHLGHTHTIGAKHEFGVTTYNAGAWQLQTSYQKTVNLSPNICKAFLIKLSDTTNFRFVDFAKSEIELTPKSEILTNESES